MRRPVVPLRRLEAATERSPLSRAEAEALLPQADVAATLARARLQEATRRREDAILAAYEAGVPTAEIMEITGLSQPNVSRAKRRSRQRAGTYDG